MDHKANCPRRGWADESTLAHHCTCTMTEMAECWVTLIPMVDLCHTCGELSTDNDGFCHNPQCLTYGPCFCGSDRH